MPSFGSGEATAVARLTLSPLEVSAAPEACLAIRPVSNLICLPPASSTVTSCFMVRLFSVLLIDDGTCGVLQRCLQARAGMQPGTSGFQAAGGLQGNVGLGTRGTCAHAQTHDADTCRSGSSQGRRVPNDAVAPHQQLRRQGPKRPCSKMKITAVVCRIWRASM